MHDGDRRVAAGRSRAGLVAASLFVCSLGLGSRRFPIFPACLGKYPGDALWAWLVFLALGFAAPRSGTRRLGIVAACACSLVECSQLYHAPWIDVVRSSRIGYLVLGTTFHPPDFLAYLAGIVVAMACDRTMRLSGAAPAGPG